MHNMQQRKIVIYIHPDQGPIKPMELDLMDVEMVALKASSDAQRDEIRIHEIAKKIQEKFKGVQPEGNRNELASLIGRLGHYTRFQGIVLRLPGVIKDDENNGAAASATVKKQLDQINKRVELLTRDLRKEREEHEVTKAQLATVKTNYKNLRALYDKLNTQLADVQLHEQQARQDAERWRKEAQRTSAEINAAQQESAGLQVKLDRIVQQYKALATTFKDQQQAWANKEEELSRLRQQAKELESAVKNLQDTVKNRDQQIAQLRRQLDGDDWMLAGSSEEGWDSNL